MRVEPQAILPVFVDDVAEAVAAYNDAAGRCGWPKVQKMNLARRAALKGRLRDCGGLDGWVYAIGRAEASDFICGRTARPWPGFSFDWLVAPANFTKLMEGNYDSRPGFSAGSPRADTLSRILDVASRARRTPKEDLF